MEIFIPILLHFGIMRVVGLLAGKCLDAGTVATLSALIAFLPVWYLYRKEPRAERRLPIHTLWIPLVLGIAGNAVCSRIFQMIRLTEQFSNDTQEALFQSIPWIQILGLGVVVPVVEEMIFRGLVYGQLRRSCGKWVGIGISALIFALYHGNIVQMLYAFPMGILLALVYEKWGMLAAPVCLHIGSNLFGVLGTLFADMFHALT